MKKILIISNYWHFPFEKSSSRYNSIVELLSNHKDFEVELITSNFRHITKSHRNYKKEYFNDYKYKVHFIDEPGYKKNVSLNRIKSHKVFANNLKKYLQSINKVDIIYSFCPSLSANNVIAKYCKNNNVKYIIDILDLWPEAFKMAFKLPIISNLLFFPMKHQANYIYKNADFVVAVSNTYVERALTTNKNKQGLSVYIGIDLKYFDECHKKNIYNYKDNIIRIAYIGTLGMSYDIKSVIDSIKILNNKGINNIEFIVMGDGPLLQTFKSYANRKNVNVHFTGSLKYDKMVELLCSCDICVNPIIENSAASIINKVADYAASSLPVINTQNNKEYKELINKYNAGFNCNNGDSKDISEKLENLIKDANLRKSMGKGNRKLAEEVFDRNHTYKEILKVIERI